MIALALVALLAAAPAASDSPRLERLARELDAATRTYDLEAARTLLAEVRSLPHESRGGAIQHARAALLVAELERIRFEQTSERGRRSELGKAIDAAAEEGLKALASIPKGTEEFRMEADLLATMIRSDFRAKKYLDRMKAATAKALELDPDNARALVTEAKPLIFAAPDQGRDLEAARRLLDRALALEPGLESALLLRAVSWDLDGLPAKAIADCKAALARNPICAPARERVDAAVSDR
jgi:hypothetical protein